MLNPLVITRRAALILGCASLSVLACSAASAQVLTPAAKKIIEARYTLDVARCNSGSASEDQATCLKEAAAVRQQALQGSLDSQPGVNQNYSQNALDRCKLLPAGQQSDCVSLMQAPSQTQGSVDGGGVLRMREYTVPARQ